MTPAEDDHQYDARVLAEAEVWRERQLRRPGLWDTATRATQDRINGIIPERVHQIVTSGVEMTTRGILTGAEWTTAKPLLHGDLRTREALIQTRVDLYRTTASVEGGVAGAGGFLLAAADFPALLAIKVKLLAEIGALYGHSGKTLPERLYLLRIFQLAFSSARHRPEALAALEAAGKGLHQPERIQDFDWRRFQLEYRDYIDLAKMAQLIPVIGAPIGAVVNWRLTTRLATTAMNAYRLRWFEDEHLT
ncbi:MULTISPECIES: EcsC family protein [unclassified Brevundimonas]|uniref:EcsC family protein n=1 Tax=unclassified Brevundimonas TaxID=2622653 RepID=UPI0025BF2A89|nr:MULTISPECIES: EcsC family protein [unclassified Brevundimonas]